MQSALTFFVFRYRNFRTFTSPRPTQFSCVAVDSSGEIVSAGAQDSFEIFVWSMQTGRLLDVRAIWSPGPCMDFRCWVAGGPDCYCFPPYNTNAVAGAQGPGCRARPRAPCNKPQQLMEGSAWLLHSLVTACISVPALPHPPLILRLCRFCLAMRGPSVVFALTQ